MVKIGQRTGMGEGPIGPLAFKGLDDGGKSELQRQNGAFLRKQRCGKGGLQFQNIRKVANRNFGRRQRRRLLFALAVAGKSIMCPLPGGRKIEFVVGGTSGRGEERLETGVFP